MKSLLGASILQELKALLGSYQLYLPVVQQTAPDHRLYIAIPESIHSQYFDEPIIDLAITFGAIPLLVVDIAKEEIAKWIN